ncbi:MAG: peptide ABC transporter substrate-binding protein [Oscillospiraceae bacterium]|nr:peptide ABC transporter substrate-binding protein [Oscillospiraceae bacterium]
MKKTLAMLLALVMMLSLVACGGGSDKDTVDVNSLSVCLASEPDTLDPALNSALDGATMILHLFSGLTTWAQDDNGNLVIKADCAEDLVDPVVNEDGTVTYTYTLKEGLTWSDGEALTAGDFEFAWKRAAASDLGSDYGYMFDVVVGYPDNLAVTALDDRTLEVTLATNVAYWNELMAFPTYMPVREDVVADEAWATDPSTYVSNGMYTMTGWEHDSVITLTKNEHYHNAAEVLMPELKCYLSDDANNMLTNFQNGDWLMIDDVPVEEIPNLKENSDGQYQVASQIGTYYVCWNVNKSLLPATSTLTGVEAEKANAEIRQAMGLLLDRNHITANISRAGEVPACGFVGMGMMNPDGTDFYKTSNSLEDDFDGYYDVNDVEGNYAKAIEILKKYYTYDESTMQFTDIPAMEYLYNTADNHKAIGEYLQAAYAGVGLNMQLVNQEWNTFLNTRKDGQFNVARNGWVADYSDPICFLDMWISASGNNDVQFGKDAHAELAMYNLDLTGLGFDIKVENGTWAETYDVLIATIKATTDNELRYEMMHMAEDMLMETGALTPIYYYTDPYMISNDVEGFFTNPLGYKYFSGCTIVAE